MSEVPVALQADLADRYTLERLIGQGGMASVFLATDRKHSRRVAVKVLQPDLAAALAADRFLREPSTRPPSPQPNFTPAAQNDFAARMKWAVTSSPAR